ISITTYHLSEMVKVIASQPVFSSLPVSFMTFHPEFSTWTAIHKINKKYNLSDIQWYFIS
ncbi:MAG: hypothetical protein II847_06640, partial [Ruminobacter sp.]|uniref:hypothetical protein n=1 Tax=Ruminobacter sp. TaxID=2774296 RepID=UPI002580514E